MSDEPTTPRDVVRFYMPHELEAELAAGELSVQGIYGVEGPSALFADLDELWSDPEAKKRVLDVARLAERDPHLIVVSPHLLGVAGETGRVTGSR